MPFPVPPIAHSTYRQLRDEAMSRIPVHTPEWKSQHDSDPGVTLVQLFAYLAEVVNYRCNLVPERNRAKFLQLLGLPLGAAQPARGLVAFANPRGALGLERVERETLVRAGRIEFRTQNALTVLPIEARLYTKSRLPEERRQEVQDLYLRLYPDLVQEGTTLDYYETEPFELPAAGVTLPAINFVEDTADAALWLALLARRTDSVSAVRDEIANKILTLGVLPAQDTTNLALPPAGFDDENAEDLVFQIPRLVGDGVRYERLEARPSANLLTHPGTVELQLPDAGRLTYVEDLDPLEPGVSHLPPSLADTDDAERLITWIRIRAPEVEAADQQSQLEARFSWVGINAAEVLQLSQVSAEKLPDGTGEPDQVAQLLHTPVLPDKVQIAVNGELWEAIDDLAAAGREAESAVPRLAESDSHQDDLPTKVYRLDAEAGLVQFGNGTFGTRPPRRATIVASYAYGGGRQGVLGIGGIDKGELPPGVQVTNPVPTWGGNEAESLADAEYRIPRFLRHRDRLVSAEDFRDITWQTPGVDLGRVEVLPLFHPSQGGVDTPGVVTLLLIPLYDPEHPETPEPDRLFLDAVCRHLDPRRLVTTELHLSGPDYQDLWVSVGVEVMSGVEQGPVLERVDVEIRRFLSPLAGGFGGAGWPLDKTVEAAEILATAARVAGISQVGEVLLADGDGNETSSIPISGLQLPRLLGISVTSGDAVPIADLLGEPPADDGDGLVRLPVPVVPEEC